MLKKLKYRNYKKYVEIKGLKDIERNLIFKIIPGDIEPWENRKKMI